MAELFPNQQLDSNNNDTAATSNSSTTDRMDLTEIIDNSSCYARNVSNAHPLSNLFIGDSTLGCKSDSDEQLIIHIAFKEFVKVNTCTLSSYLYASKEKRNKPMTTKFGFWQALAFAFLSSF